jgi:hypothetical protein
MCRHAIIQDGWRIHPQVANMDSVLHMYIISTNVLKQSILYRILNLCYVEIHELQKVHGREQSVTTI